MILIFDLETGMRVASKVGNLPSKFGHASVARSMDSQIIRYVRDGWTARQPDGWTKATIIARFPTGRGIVTLSSADSLKSSSNGSEQGDDLHMTGT